MDSLLVSFVPTGYVPPPPASSAQPAPKRSRSTEAPRHIGFHPVGLVSSPPGGHSSASVPLQTHVQVAQPAPLEPYGAVTSHILTDVSNEIDRMGRNLNRTQSNITDVVRETLQPIVASSLRNDTILDTNIRNVAADSQAAVNRLEANYTAMNQQFVHIDRMLQALTLSQQRMEHQCSSIPNLQHNVNNLLHNAGMPGPPV